MSADATHYVDLWLSNDESLYRQALELARTAQHSDTPRADLADSLKEMVVSIAEREHPSLFETGNMLGDIVTDALSCADWYRMAHEWLDVVKEEEE